MKTVLFATTALIATASVAAADVAFSGYGRFGADYNSGRAAGAEIAQTSRFRLQADATTEADNGLSFAARVRFEDAQNAAMSNSGARFTVAAGGLSVSVGNIVGAIDGMAGMYPLGTKSAGLGLDGEGFRSTIANTVTHGAFNFDGYSSKGNGAQGVAVSYSAGDFSTTVSYSNLARAAGAAAEERTAVTAAYTFSGWTVALGYQDSSDNAHDLTAMTVGGNVGIADVGFQVAQVGSGAAVSVLKYQITAGFEVGAATRVYGYVNSEDNGVGESYGLGVSHNLGGGASIEASAGQDALAGAGTNTTASLGLAFSF